MCFVGFSLRFMPPLYHIALCTVNSLLSDNPLALRIRTPDIELMDDKLPLADVPLLVVSHPSE